MIGALIIFLFTAAVGLLLWALDRSRHASAIHDEPESDSNPSSQESQTDAQVEECCGQHIVCERESLSPFSDEVVYYDDEELDRFRGRGADEYSSDEIEEFRDVLETLLPSDLAGWGRSITLREITLPSEIRDEFLLLINEIRR